MTYTVDDLFSSINDIYSQYDSGKINIQETNHLMTNCCQAFLDYMQNKENTKHEVS
jgi:hypothetical protein